jgi:hypothetical protein
MLSEYAIQKKLSILTQKDFIFFIRDNLNHFFTPSSVFMSLKTGKLNLNEGVEIFNFFLDRDQVLLEDILDEYEKYDHISEVPDLDDRIYDFYFFRISDMYIEIDWSIVDYEVHDLVRQGIISEKNNEDYLDEAEVIF